MIDEVVSDSIIVFIQLIRSASSMVIVIRPWKIMKSINEDLLVLLMKLTEIKMRIVAPVGRVR